MSRLGSIEWCCLPHLDSPSHFASLLDRNLGGSFQLSPQGDFHSKQRYLQRTQVLETLFETPHGRAVLTDWMPMEKNVCPEPVIYRRLELIQGKISWSLFCSPRFFYGARGAQAEFHRNESSVLFRGDLRDELCQLHVGNGIPLEIPKNRASASCRFDLEAGESLQFSWAWGSRIRVPDQFSPTTTIEAWRAFSHRCNSNRCIVAGPWHDGVARSLLILKLLSAHSTGSFAESITTSVPGITGGNRNWDYRFAWIRDGAYLIQALATLGYQTEASEYFLWLSDILLRDGAEGLQPVYTLDGGRHLPETELGHLSGYQGSRPVRAGNLSHSRFQLDIFGHILLAAAEYFKIFGPLPERLWPKLAEIADYVCQAWRRPDHGPWEMRSKPDHFVASKVYCWAAIDRAEQLAKVLGKNASRHWSNEKEILRKTILTQGFDSELGSFVRSFGGRELDAAVLAIPLVGFLPIQDPKMLSTLNVLQENLSEGVLLRRYRGSDGIEGTDALHLQSSLYFITCLALSGRVDEASDRLAELCTYATPLGLLGEQIDLATEETTGNFPSASAHLALINAALYVNSARSRLGLALPLLGREARGLERSEDLVLDGGHPLDCEYNKCPTACSGKNRRARVLA